MKINGIFAKTNRKYVFSFIEGSEVVSGEFFLDNLFTPDTEKGEEEGNLFEWKYAVLEEFDRLLDMKYGETISMKFNRDSSDDFIGVIKRVN